MPLWRAASRLALAAQLEIDLGQLEAVASFAPSPPAGGAPSPRGSAEQDAVALVAAAADPAAQLVQLGEPEAVGLLDHHDHSRWARPRRPRSRSSPPAPSARPARNALHHRRRCGRRHLPVHHADRVAGAARPRAAAPPRSQRPSPRRAPTRSPAGRRRTPAGPRPAAARMRANTSSRRARGTSRVTTGFRPGGSSSSTDTSRSP